jgi:hypothetical protein
MSDSSKPTSALEDDAEGSLDVTALAQAYRELLGAVTTVTGAGEAPPPPGQWNASQILAHVSLITTQTIVTVCTVGSLSFTTYDNRMAHDNWTLGRIADLAEGIDGLQRRLELQANALVALTSGLNRTELATEVPTILVSNGSILIDDLVSLRGLIDGLTSNELPGHTRQLLSLRHPSSPE